MTPLRILHTECASVARPVVAFIDDLREREHKQVIVLIPVIVPDRLRYRLLHTTSTRSSAPRSGAGAT